MEVGDAMEVEEEADISGEGHPELYIVYWVIYTIFYILGDIYLGKVTQTTLLNTK